MRAYYDQIVSITEEYLGPAAGRFINRQIASHLNKSPEDLEKSDIPKLAIRIRSGLVVLTRDEKLVEEAFQRINEVSQMDGYTPQTNGISQFAIQ